MEKKPEVYLKVGQVWLRERKIRGIAYKMYYRIDIKNSNNMWHMQLIVSTPANPPQVEQYTQEWWHKDRILESMSLIANEADIKTIIVLYG